MARLLHRPIRAATGASPPRLPTDVRMLQMLADRMPQAVGFFCAKRRPTYLNPSFLRMLGLAGHDRWHTQTPRFRMLLSRECGTAEPMAAVVRTMRRLGHWRGDISIGHDEREHWSLAMSGRIELLREGTRLIGYAVIGSRKRASPAAGRDTLTRREQQVLDALLAGHRSKAIGQQLGISPRTAEAHRASILRKLGARSLPDLFRTLMGDGRHG